MRTNEEGTRSAIIFMLLFTAGWFVVEDVFGHAIRNPLNVLQIIWCRYLVHLFVVILVFRRQRFWHTTRPRYQLARSALMLTMPLGFVGAIVAGATAEQAWAGFWIAPTLMLVFGWLLNREAPGPLTVLLVCISSAAAVVVVGSGPAWAPLPFTGTFIMAASFAIYVAMTRSLRTETLAANLFYTALVPFLALAPVMPLVWLTPDLTDGLAIAGIGVVGFVSLFFLDRAAAARLTFTAPILPVLTVFPTLAALASGLGFPALPTLAGVTVIGAVAFMSLATSHNQDKLVD